MYLEAALGSWKNDKKITPRSVNARCRSEPEQRWTRLQLAKACSSASAEGRCWVVAAGCRFRRFCRYCGNCMRYALGWGFQSKIWIIIAAVNMIWLLVAAIICIAKMESTTKRVDNSDPSDDLYVPDAAFGFAELFCVIMEVWASIYYVCRINRSGYAITATFFNVVGWMSVYATGLWSVYSGAKYDTRITQLIFHYSMIVLLWSINELALIQSSQIAGGGGDTDHEGSDEEKDRERNDVAKASSGSFFGSFSRSYSSARSDGGGSLELDA